MMKKYSLLFKRAGVIAGSAVAYLVSAVQVFAQTPTSIVIEVTPPPAGVPPTTTLSTVIKNAFVLVFSIAALLVLFMLVWGGIQWITSGGDKEAIDKARKRIINALIGLAILAVAFLLATVVGNIIGIDLMKLPLPQLGQE